MAKRHKAIINIDENVSFPKGFTISDNRIEDYLQKFLKPSEYCVWRQYLRYWGGDKSVAYPSLSKVSEKTGLSEKTIRTANKELVKKGFLKYRSGCANRSNQYHYIPIEELIKKYYGSTTLADAKKDCIEPIEQYDKIQKETFNLFNKISSEHKAFFTTFSKAYKEKMGMKYVPSKSDMKTLSTVNFKDTILDKMYALVRTFFNSRNSYIERCDYTLFFFLRPKTQQIIISEYNQTDEGMWTAQAEKHWDKIEKVMGTVDWSSHEEMEIMIKELLGARLSGASKERDDFVVNYLIDKLKAQQ